MHATRKKVSRRLTIAFAVIALLTFVFKELLENNLKEMHDSVAKAEEQHETETGQTNISAQILNTQQEIELLKLQDQKYDPKRDSVLITQDIGEAREAETNVDAYFDSVSRLIDELDKLPSGAKNLRSARDQTQKSIEQMHQRVDDLLKPQTNHDVWRFLQVKVAMGFALIQVIPVAVLADAALTRAHRIEEASEALSRICSWITYILGLSALILGLYAAIRRVNVPA
jgi:hypothetical protein